MGVNIWACDQDRTGPWWLGKISPAGTLPKKPSTKCWVSVLKTYPSRTGRSTDVGKATADKTGTILATAVISSYADTAALRPDRF